MCILAKCQKLAKDKYQFLKIDEGVQWFCKFCERGVVKIRQVMKKLNDKQLHLEGRQSALQCDVNKVKRTLNDIT